MGLVSIKEVWNGRTGTFEIAGGLVHRTYERHFRIRTDSETDSAVTVAFDNPIVPLLGSFYVSFNTGEFDTAAICVRKTPTQSEEDPLVWMLVCEFDSQAPEFAAYDANGNPTTPGQGGKPGGPHDSAAFEPWEFEGEVITQTKGLRVAIAEPPTETAERNVAVVNSARDPYDPLPEYLSPRSLVTVTRNEPTLDLLTMLRYSMAINSDDWNGFPPGKAQMHPIKWSRFFRNGQYWYKKTYKIELISPDEIYDTFQVRLPDMGFRQFKDFENAELLDPVPIRQGDSQTEVTTPQLLNGAGRVLTPEQKDAGGVVYRDFNAYRMLPFAPFKLNIPL
jgi:hypothetical protein